MMTSLSLTVLIRINEFMIRLQLKNMNIIKVNLNKLFIINKMIFMKNIKDLQIDTLTQFLIGSRALMP